MLPSYGRLLFVWLFKETTAHIIQIIPRRPDPDSYRDHRDRDCLGCSALIIWLCKEPKVWTKSSSFLSRCFGTCSIAVLILIPRTLCLEVVHYLTRMDRIETLTGLRFMTVLDPSPQDSIKAMNSDLTKAKKDRLLERGSLLKNIHI